MLIKKKKRIRKQCFGTKKLYDKKKLEYFLPFFSIEHVSFSFHFIYQ